MIQPIGDGIWSVPAPLTFFGLRLNTRMTVCRLTDGGLVLISPVGLDDGLKAAIDALGPVRALVSPNLLHHLYMGEWMDAYPDAQSFAPPGLDAKRPELACTHELGAAFDDTFGDELTRFPISGMPRLNESIFFHVASATLIATDFCFFLPDATGLTGLFASVMGITKKTKCEPAFRALVRDRNAFRTSLEPLRNLTIRHLSMCHHSVLSTKAPAALDGVLKQLKVP